MRGFDSACFVTGAHVDLAGTLFAPTVAAKSNPGRLARRPGGVGLNTASVTAALGLATTLAGPVGDDHDGGLLKQAVRARGIGDGLVALPGAATGTFVSIIAPDGEMVIGLADLSIYEAADAAWFLARCRPALEAAGLWFLTANQTAETLGALAQAAGDRLVAAAAVSAAKAARLKPALARVDLLFANLGEARILAGMAGAPGEAIARELASQGVGAGVISAAQGPVTFWQDGVFGTLAPPATGRIADVNGAGDALAGTVLAGLARGLAMERCVGLGIAAAQLTLGVAEPVHPGLSWPLLERHAEAIAPAGQRR